VSTATIELLFPIGLYKSKVDHIFSKKETDKIKNEKYLLGHNKTYTNFDYRFLDNLIFSKLKNKLQLHVDNYTKDVFKYDAEIYITQSWINVNPPGTCHTAHNHSNSVFSGVYYVTLPKGSPFLTFQNPLEHMFSFTPTEWNSYNSNVWTVGVEEKDVVIFPSKINHEVLTNNTDETRVSIAFNTFVRGYVGDKGTNESNYQIIK
jgi:uncharacterized protein (TIGR02466 family)